MRLALEQGKESLAHDRREVIVHLPEEQVAAYLFLALLGQQFVHQHHLAEGGSCFG